MSEQSEYDVFVSYCREDESRVLPLAKAIAAAGLTVWLDQWIELPGLDLRSKVTLGIQSSRRILYCVSRASLLSSWSKFELNLALVHDENNDQRRLIPLFLDHCEVPDGLAIYDAVDCRQIDAASIQRVIHALRAGNSSSDAGGASADPKSAARLRPIHNIQSRQNRIFQGRSEVLDTLYRQFHSGPEAPPQVIFGLGGVGKTQVALEYAYRYASRYALIWWIKAEYKVTAQQDLFALAAELRLPEAAAANDSTITAVRRWLDQHDGWLLIFDNASARRSIKDFLPLRDNGHVLITSRNEHWNTGELKVAIDVLQPAEAIHYLASRTRQIDPALNGELADLLGHLPLALDQAASFILEAGIEVRQYIDLFRENPQNTLRAGTPSEGYADTVATTWNLAFERVRGETPGAAELQAIIAHCTTDRLPRALFLHRKEVLPAPLRSGMEIHQAIARLRAYSLVSVSDDDLLMHRLVRQITRDRHDPAAFDAKAIADLLYQRQGSIELLKHRLVDVDDDAANSLSAMLCDAPVALTQAAAQIAHLGVGVERYAARLARTGTTPAVEAGAVALTTNLAIADLRHFPDALDLVSILAHYDGEPLPAKKLHRPDVLPSALRSEAALQNAIALLEAYGLIAVQRDEPDRAEHDWRADLLSIPAPVRDVLKRHRDVPASRPRAVAETLFGGMKSKVDFEDYPTYHLRLTDVDCGIQQQPALFGVNLTIPYHQVTSIVGTGGSGMSTLLRVLAGRHFWRDLTVRGSVEQHPHVGRGVALVTSEAALTPRQSVGQSFSAPLKIAAAVSGERWRRTRAERIERALRRAALWDELKDRLEFPVEKLSIGQQRQLKLAHALCTNPDLLLIDAEPMSLDPIHLMKVEETLSMLKDSCTIILGSHNLLHAARVSDYTAFLFRGRVIEFDQSRVIFTRPSERLTDDFITGRFG